MCRICQYNQRQDIDRALLAGASLADLSRRYNFTVPELEHHQEHLHRKVALATRRYQANLHQMLYAKLNLVMEMTLTVVRKTRHNEDPKLFLQAGREFTRIINLMDRMAARLPLDPEFVYCLMASPQWVEQDDALMPYAFPAISDTRQSMQQNLFAPCPDPQREPVADSPPGYQPAQAPSPEIVNTQAASPKVVKLPNQTGRPTDEETSEKLAGKERTDNNFLRIFRKN